MRFRVEALGFGVEALGFTVEALGKALVALTFFKGWELCRGDGSASNKVEMIAASS